jgi:hypothetical protein
MELQDDVGFDGALGDRQPGGDAPVRPALGNQPEDLLVQVADPGGPWTITEENR